MQKSILRILFIAVCASTACADGTGENEVPVPDKAVVELDYIEAKSFNNIPAVSVSNIHDFSKLLSDYKVKHVFYTSNAFFFQAPSIPYPFTIASNGYKSIADFIDGNDKAFKDGASFYYAREKKLASQAEVDYYQREGFFSPEDYRSAQRAGFVNVGQINRMAKISGILSEKDLQANIRCANAIIWLMYYQQTDPVKEFVGNKDIDKLLLPFTNNRSYPNYIVRIQPGYYFVNLDINNLHRQSQDSVFFYACTFALYASLNDYKTSYNSSVSYTIKNSEKTARAAGYASYQDCVTAVNQLIGDGRSR